MQLLKGKPVSDYIKEKTTDMVSAMLEKNIVPTLGILRVGANESDMAYENSAVKTANALGIHIEKYIMDADSDESDILDVLKVMNEDGNIHGILLFRPLPESVDEDKIRNHIAPQKDVDGISDASVAGLFTGNRRGFPPCTAEAAIAILDYYGIGLEGKKVTVIGRSLVVGKPVSMMLLDRNAAVTMCHSRVSPEDLVQICKNSDIIISAAGRINTVTADHVSGSQTIIDVGINFDPSGKMCGDADMDDIGKKASAITPVPGGVGSVTTALLMYHVAEAAEAAAAKQED